MNIVLINPPLPYDSIGTSGGQRFFPEGLASIASALLHAGHKVRVIDMCTGQQLTSEVCGDAEIFGITGMINQFANIEDIISRLRKLNSKAKILLGGPLVTCAPELIKQLLDFDLAIIGEGERSVVELLQNPTEKMVANNNPYLLPKEFVMPAFELFDLRWYLSGPTWPHYQSVGMAKVVGNLMVSRGCPRPQNCAFCGQLFGHTMRCKPFNLVEGEIRAWIDAGAQGIRFQDDNLCQLPPELQELVFDLLKKHELPWVAHSRVDTVSPAKLARMREAGCRIIYFGLESFSDQALSSAGKGATVDEAKRAVELTREAGIKPACFFLIGLPGETRASLQAAVKFARDQQILARPYILCPIPGTPMFERAKHLITDLRDYLRHCANWADRQLADGKLYANLTNLPDDILLEAYRELREL